MGEHTADDYVRAYDSLQFLLGKVEADALARRRPVTAGTAGTALPVVVVAGFLGAGKTTLLAHLLARPGGRRITALVNDMAALDIDAGLIAERHDNILSLTNGCAYCSQSGGAARALLDVLTRPERPDLVLLEASGIADPWALAQIVGGLPGHRLDHVVTLVDATGPATQPLFPRAPTRRRRAGIAQQDRPAGSGRERTRDRGAPPPDAPGRGRPRHPCRRPALAYPRRGGP